MSNEPTPKPKFLLDPNGLYVIRTDYGNAHGFHWGLYLAKSQLSGAVYHLNGPSIDALEYETKTSNTVVYSRNLLLALKVADVTGLHDLLAVIVASVPVAYSSRFREEVTCRVWLKEVLFALDQSGLIKILNDVDAIEQEGHELAMVNKHLNRAEVRNSRNTQVSK